MFEKHVEIFSQNRKGSQEGPPELWGRVARREKEHASLKRDTQEFGKLPRA